MKTQLHKSRPMNAKQRLARLASRQLRLSHFDSALALLTLAKPRSVKCSFPSVILAALAVAFVVASHTVQADQLTMLTAFGPPRSSNPSGLVNVNGTLFFVASDVNDNGELWKSDGTTVGTVLVKDIRDPYTRGLSQVVNVDGTLFFSAYDGIGYGLWKTDGTPAGTVLVKDINPSDRFNLVNVNGTLFFGTFDDVTGGKLWKSDGTAAGTV